MSASKTAFGGAVPRVGSLEEQHEIGKGEDRGRRFVPFSDKSGSASKKCDTLKTVTKWAGIALLIAGLVIGLVGLLVYLNVLQLGLNGVGTMSSATGLYLMLAGFGLTFVLTVTLGIAKFLNREKPSADSTKGCCTWKKKASSGSTSSDSALAATAGLRTGRGKI